MKKQVTILGAGPGAVEQLTLAAQRAVQQAQLLIGAPRLLHLFQDSTAEKQAAILAGEIVQVIQQSSCQVICVVLSGDTGFYSGAKGLLPLLTQHTVQVLPGIGSLQYLCSKIHISWQDVFLVSAHGRQVNIPAMAYSHETTFFLTGGSTTVQSLCEQLTENGLGEYLVTAGSRLSYPEEQIITGSAKELMQREFDPLSAVLVQRTKLPFWPYAAGGTPDELFLRGAVPMTKQEVRAVALSALRVQPEDVLYDIGGGTGSVSVEMALSAPMGQVYSIEPKAEAQELIRQNRLKFGAFAITVVPGTAPEALEALPAPKAAFIGGSGGRLKDILNCLVQKNPAVRVVITAVTIETVQQALQLLEQMQFTQVQAVQLAVTRTEPAGHSHLLRAQNPVFLISGQGAQV